MPWIGGGLKPSTMPSRKVALSAPNAGAVRAHPLPDPCAPTSPSASRRRCRHWSSAPTTGCRSRQRRRCPCTAGFFRTPSATVFATALRAIERGGGRQQRHQEDVALIFVRHAGSPARAGTGRGDASIASTMTKLDCRTCAAARSRPRRVNRAVTQSKPRLKMAERRRRLAVLLLQEDRAERRRQRQRDDAGDHHRDRDGDGELPVELAGEAAEERHRNEHRAQHQHDRDDRAR